MLRRFQVDFQAQSPVGESSVVDPRTILSKQMCIHILGLLSVNLESIDLYEVGDLEPELGITPVIVLELRHELERAASVRNHDECRLPKEIQVAAAETVISGVSALYSSPSDKLNLLLYLLRSHMSAAFEPDSARHLLLSALLRILASPGKEGILTFLPFLSAATMFNSSNEVSIGAPFVQEIIGLLVQVIQQPEHQIESPSVDNRTAKDSDLAESRSLAHDAMLLLKSYQLFLLAEAVSLTKSKRSGDADLETLGGLGHSEQSHRRALVQESTLQYGFLLLRACHDVIESLVVEQTENSFLQSPAVCELQANIRTHNIPILSELLPWFVSCLCLLRRQTWLARPILPAICRLLGSFDQYCSELHVVNKSDSRFRKLELHEKARMIESQELDRMLAVDKSLVVNRQASKQMYNVFKQLYTGDKDHFEGQIGFQFEATSTFLVVALGRSVNPAKNSGRLIRQHTVRLWEEASQTLIAQVTVSGTSKKDSMGYALEPLVSPVKLSQGKLYRLTTQEFANGGDPWYKKENLPDEEYDSSYIKILRDCYASGSTGFPNSQNLSGAAYGVPTFLVEGENPVASIPRFASPFGSLSVKFNVKRKGQSVSVSHSGTSAHLIGESASWRNCFLQTAFYQGVHSVDFIVKSARVGGTISGHICIGVDWTLCSEPQPWSPLDIKYVSFLGETQNSIGWMPSIGALWVCGKRARYGTKLSLVSGDILTLVVDYDMQTLSFAYNGQRMGVAVGLPELRPASSSLTQLPEALTPGVSIYGPQDTVQIRPSGIAKSTLRIHWLFDLHNSLSSLAGRVAGTLIAAHPVDGVEEELLPWLQSPLLSGGILSAASSESSEPQDSNVLSMDWKSALQYEYSMYPSNPALRSDILGGRGTKETGSSVPVKRNPSNSNLYSDDSYAIRQGKFFENLSQNITESGPVQIILNWLETRSPDRSFLSRLGKFPHCERLTCVALIKHAPAHVLHEVQAIVAGSESSQADPTKPSDLIDHSNLEPSEDLLLVWKRIISLRHWLIKTRQEYRAKAQDDLTMATELITLDPGNATGADSDDGISFEKTLLMPKTFDDLVDQVCQRAEFLCLLDPPSEEKDKLGVDSQVALSNLAEKWSSQKTPPSLQPMLERWKSLGEADSSKWSGIVDVLRAQDRWRSRRASVVTIPTNLNEDKPDMNKATAQPIGEQEDDSLYRRRRYHYKDSFSAMMKACDLYIRNGIGAPPVVLRALLERRQKRSDSRLFGLHAMKTILSILSFDTARHNAIIFLRPALRGFTDDEKESRELNDGQVVTETFRATVRHHYLKGLEGCNRPTIERVQLAFCDLYSFLAQLLNSSSTGRCSHDSLLKHAILCAWSLDFEPRDHPFLLKAGILTTIHNLFSIESSRRDAAADLTGMKAAARAHLDQVSTTANALEYTTINWHPLSEEFVQQSVLHTGYVTKRDILRLLLRAPPYACTKAWWKQNGLEFIFEANGSASVSNARHTASSMALLYAELLKKLEMKLSWCRPHLLGRKVLQFGMASAIQGATAGQSKPEEISYAETPALGEVQDFCIELWRFYERVCKTIHFRAARIGCWVNEIDAHGVTTATASPQRSFKGSIAEMRIWCTSRTGEQIQRDFQRSIPYEIQVAPAEIEHDSENPQRASLLALWHLNEGEGVCGYDRSPSLAANDGSIAAAENAIGRNADISGCHWAKMNVPVVSNAALDTISLPKWIRVMNGIIIMQRKVRALCHLQYRRAVKSSRLVCQYEESLFAERWNDLSDEDDDDEDESERDVEAGSSSSARNELQELDSKAKELVKEWSASTDQQILLKKQTKKCAWIVFRFLATIGIGGVYERREGEAKSVAAIAKMKRKQKLQKGDSISELGSPMHQRMVNQGKPDAARAAGLSYEEEDQQARTIEAASDAAKTAATNRELEEPVLQTLWFSQELHRKVFEVIERELVLGTTLIQDAEGLTRAQRMLRSLSTPVKRKGETLRSHTSGIEGSRVKIIRPSQRMPSDLASQGEVLETLEVEMYTFAMLGFVLSLSGSSPALHHLSKPKILRELLELLRTGSPRSQRVVKLLLRKVCSNGVVTPAHVSSLLGSESVLVDLLLDQVAESVCSTAAPLSTPSVGALSTSSSESSNQALLSESLSNPMGFRSGQIYLVLASESVALLRLLLKEKSWQARVAELLCSAIRNVAPVLARRKSESSTLGSSESSDIRIRAAIIRAVGALCVLGSHSDCIRIGGRVEVTAKETRAGQVNLDYGFNFSDRGAEPAPATLIELNSRTSTVRVVFDASSEEFDPSHNVQEVNLSSLSPIEEIRLPSDVIPLTMDMMPVILKLSSLEESSIMASFDDLWRMQVRSRALLALEAILRHSIQMTANVAHKHISKSLLKSALTPVCLNTFVSLPFLQERGRMILGRLIESSTPLGSAIKIDSKGRLFSVKFRGEEGVDWGGVYREGANSMVDDLFSAHFSLFVLCPNGQHDTGTNRGMYLPNPKCTSPVAIQMYEFVGKLLGISLRTHGDFPFAFPSLVWKQLINQPLDQSDLEGTDAMFVQMLDGIQNCERDGILTEEEFDAAFEGLDLRFTAFDCNGQEVELVEGGKTMRVTFQNRLEYCHLAEQYRLYEGSLQVAAMARGFATIFPMRALTLLTWQEMEILTCGSPKIDIVLWKQHTRYDGYNENDDTVKLFWDAMESFTDEQRSDFVRFAWGRSRLPRGKWPQPFKLTKKGGRDSIMSLPVAHTCFFSVELPPYTTMDKMRNMLLATINFGLGGILMA
uniref:HECT domain-containing protein n=1 Tax=Globisporangium ultimum (strain ATCC 200006 / CBS 805.95 / DAOM BR144) TaxID=431595 RepID=K3X786_GLOUD